MSNTSIALLTGLVAGGFGIIGTAIGVALGYWLQKRSEKRTQVEKETLETYERLLRLHARLNLLLILGSDLPHVSGMEQREYEDDMCATALELSILVSRAEHMPETEDIIRLTSEVVLHRFSEDIRRGLAATIAKMDLRLKNQDYIAARNKVRDESKEEKEKAIKALGHSIEL